MRKKVKINKRKSFLLLVFLFSTSFLSLQSLKKITTKDIKIYGTNIFSKSDLLNNSSLKLPSRLIFIKTKYIEKELKQNLSLKNISVRRQILPFGLKILIKTRTAIAHGEKIIDRKKISGFIDENGFFIDKKYVEKVNFEELQPKVFGWKKKFRKTLSVIFAAQKNNEIDLVKVNFSPNGFLTLEDKDLKIILLGFNHNLIGYQLQIISSIKDQLKEKNFSEEIDMIDLTDPNNPKIKVFKP